jgi:hypothetical protein
LLFYCRAALGEHIHAVMAAGRLQVEELAEELDEDCSWLEAQQQQQTAAAAAGEAAGWSIPPEGVSSRRWSRALPVMLQVKYIVLTLRLGLSYCWVLLL